jgi:hypothetical protein
VGPARPARYTPRCSGAGGTELPLYHAAIEAAPPDAAPITLAPMSVSAGHFVSDVDLEPGTWTFLITVLTEDGRDLTAAFEQTFDGGGP